MKIRTKYGYIIYNHNKERTGFYINKLYIYKPYRQQGKGKELLKKLLNTLQGTIDLICSEQFKSDYERLKTFYINFGFKVSEEYFNYKGVKECIMKRELIK
jgi:predicted GNAT family N-acyltransferase